MITGEIKSKVDSIWNTIWAGCISSFLSIIVQLTYLLSIKRLDELHTLKTNMDNRFKETSPDEMFTTVRYKAFPFIKTLDA